MSSLPLAAIMRLAATMMAWMITDRALAAGCNFELVGQGRVASVLDARTFKLEDGRDVRLIGIEPVGNSAAGMAELSALLTGHQVVLRGESDAPDRYGRQQAFVFVEGADRPVQSALLNAGVALTPGTIADKACAAELATAETTARQAKRGVWGQPGVIKNAESSGDILAKLGQFTLVEGKVLSARLAGSTFYINFGRRWTRDFAVIIPRRMLGSFARDGIDLTSLKGRRVRVRGWVERRGGPRIEMLGTGQIEMLDRP
jgi:endonuclease YncB( thermonuclease family)